MKSHTKHEKPPAGSHGDDSRQSSKAPSPSTVHRPVPKSIDLPSNKKTNDEVSAVSPSNQFGSLKNAEANSATGSSPNSDEETSSHRTGFASKTLQELEQGIRSRNHKGQSARVLSLKFNECSSTCIAKWVAKRSRPVPDHSLFPPRTQVFISAVNAPFRVCTICQRIGHYEIECPDQLPGEREQLQEYVQKRKKRRLRESSDFLLQQLNGFLIQQSREGLVAHVATTVEPPAAAVCSDDSEDRMIDGFRIEAYRNKPLAMRPSFQLGSIFTWQLGDGSGVKTCAGMILSLPEKDSDMVNLKCISVLPHGDPTNGDSEDLCMVGKQFQVSIKDLRPIAASFDRIPSVEDSSSSVTEKVSFSKRSGRTLNYMKCV